MDGIHSMQRLLEDPTEEEEIRAGAARVLGAAAQNNPEFSMQALDAQCLETLADVLSQSAAPDTLTAALSAFATISHATGLTGVERARRLFGRFFKRLLALDRPRLLVKLAYTMESHLLVDGAAIPDVLLSTEVGAEGTPLQRLAARMLEAEPLDNVMCERMLSLLVWLARRAPDSATVGRVKRDTGRPVAVAAERIPAPVAGGAQDEDEWAESRQYLAELQQAFEAST